MRQGKKLWPFCWLVGTPTALRPIKARVQIARSTAWLLQRLDLDPLLIDMQPKWSVTNKTDRRHRNEYIYFSERGLICMMITLLTVVYKQNNRATNVDINKLLLRLLLGSCNQVGALCVGRSEWKRGWITFEFYLHTISWLKTAVDTLRPLILAHAFGSCELNVIALYIILLLLRLLFWLQLVHENVKTRDRKVNVYMGWYFLYWCTRMPHLTIIYDNSSM